MRVPGAVAIDAAGKGAVSRGWKLCHGHDSFNVFSSLASVGELLKWKASKA